MATTARLVLSARNRTEPSLRRIFTPPGCAELSGMLLPTSTHTPCVQSPYWPFVVAGESQPVFRLMAQRMVVQLNTRLSFLVAVGALGMSLRFAHMIQPSIPEEVICPLTPAVVVIHSDCSLTNRTWLVPSVMSPMRPWLPRKSTPPPLVGPPPLQQLVPLPLLSTRVSL